MRRTLLFHQRMPTLYLSLLVQVFGTLVLWLSCLPLVGQAYAVAPITPSGLNTQVSEPATLPSGQTQYNITGGTRLSGVTGANLFHSFGDFNVPTNNIANFLNAGSIDLAGHPLAAGLPTSNILGSVTGVDPSIIFGTIQTNGTGGFGNANLFLINPHGFLFGPNATLNVGGMVAFTTADYLRLANGVLFNASRNAAADALLSAAPVVAFGFLGSNPAAIAVQGSTLTVAPGQSISLVGGNSGFEYTDPDTGLTASTPVPDGVAMTGGKLLALGGQINLASVASLGEVSAINFMPAPGMTMGDISLSQGALLDVSADVSANAAGAVRIRSGALVMDNATISADTVNAHGTLVAVDIIVTGDLSVSDSRGLPAITARTTGLGNAGEVRITSTNLEVTSSALSPFLPSDTFFAIIDTHTSSIGTAGNVSIDTTGNLNVTGQPTGPFYFIDSGTVELDGGHGGDVTMTAENIRLQDANINTGDNIAVNSLRDSAGSGGNVTITADTLSMTHSGIATDGFWAGRAGDLTINVRDIEMNSFSALSLREFEGGGKLTINADRLIADSALFDSETVFGPGGGFTITAKVVELKNGTTLRSQTVGDGDAGDIRITATDHLTLADRFSSDPNDETTFGARVNPTGLYTNSLGNSDLGTLGNAGSIFVTTPRLEMIGGARINSTTQSSGHGGDVIITATNQLTISGERPIEVIEEGLFGLGSTRASGIYTRTVGSEFCTDACGGAGNVTITTRSLTLQNGGLIDSGTTNNGQGGNIDVSATGQIRLSGTMLDGTPGGTFSRSTGTASDSGIGGNIDLTGGQSVTISDGASISANSTGPGNAGNISINAGQQFEMRDSSVTTQATKASGGNIDIRAVDRVRLINSEVSSSVQGGASTAGGNITIDPNVIVLQDSSNVTATAVRGAGGSITLTTPLFLKDSSSQVSASSEFGLNGTVTIQSPTSNLSGSLGPLTSTPSQAQALLTQRCAALASGQASSFVVAGREQLPSDPGGWLSSPLAFTVSGENHDAGHAMASAPATMPIAGHDTGTVSLRRLTPTGFLMANFADSAATGCHS